MNRQQNSPVIWVLVNSFNASVFPDVIELHVLYCQNVQAILWICDREFFLVAFGYAAAKTENFKTFGRNHFPSPVDSLVPCCVAIHCHILTNVCRDILGFYCQLSKGTCDINRQMVKYKLSK